MLLSHPRRLPPASSHTPPAWPSPTPGFMKGERSVPDWPRITDWPRILHEHYLRLHHLQRCLALLLTHQALDSLLRDQQRFNFAILDLTSQNSGSCTNPFPTVPVHPVCPPEAPLLQRGRAGVLAHFWRLGAGCHPPFMPRVLGLRPPERTQESMNLDGKTFRSFFHYPLPGI